MGQKQDDFEIKELWHISIVNEIGDDEYNIDDFGHKIQKYLILKIYDILFDPDFDIEEKLEARKMGLL